MKRRWIIGGLIVGALLVLIISRTGGLKPGELAPDFSLPSLSRTTRSLSSFKGKVVLINFWASWCPPCLIEMPSLEQLHDRLRVQGFTVIAVAVDEEGWGAIEAFLKKVKVTFPILLDQASTAADLYHVGRLPVSYLVDREGRIARRFDGMRDWGDGQIVARIEGVLGEAK